MTTDRENKAKTSEQLASEAAILKAMEDDLGVARMDELPVEDGEPSKKGNKGGKKHGCHDYGDHQPRCEPRRQAQAVSAALVARSSRMSNVWKDAIASGVFDDDDAAEVKELDALGGPRLHATRNQYQIKQDAKNRTIALMNFQKEQTRNLHPYTMYGQMPPAKKPRHSSAKVQQTVKSGAAFGGQRKGNQNISSSNMADPSRHISVSSVPNRSVSRPAQGPHRVVQPAPKIVSIPPSQYGGNQQIADPPNMVARAEVLLTPSGKQGSLPSIVFLTIAPVPALGFCMMFVDNTLSARFTIAEYQDFMSSDLTLSLHVGLETVLFFSLTFRTASELEGFLKVLRDIKAGKYVIPAIESSVSVPKHTPKISVASTQAAPTEAASTTATPPKAASTKAAPAKVAVADTALEKPVVRLPPPTAPKAVQYAARMLAGEPNSSRQPNNQHSTGPTQGVLISLDGDETSPIKEPRSSEASAILSSLQPYGSQDTEPSTPTQNGASGDASALVPFDQSMSRANTPTQNGILTLEPTKWTVPAAVAVLRNILATFIMKNADGKTKQQLAAAVEGIQEAVMDVVCQGLTESEKREIVAQIEDHLDSSAATSGKRRRVQYTEQEMLSMRESQVQPPVWLAGLIQQLPRREASLHTSTVNDVATNERIRRFTVGMEWVLGKTESPAPSLRGEPSVPAPPDQTKTEQAKEDVPAQPSIAVSQPAQATVKAKPDVGLQASRWSLGVAGPIQNKNAFTGLPYEKRWKKGSYLYELAQLDPQAKIDASVNDMVNLFFPSSQENGELKALVSVQMVNSSATLQPSHGDLSSDTQMGDLRRNMARLTLESSSESRATSRSSVQREQLISIEEHPTPPDPSFNAAARTFTPTARAFTPTPPPATPSAPSSTSTLRGLGSSRHASRAALPTAGQFNFHLPWSHRE